MPSGVIGDYPDSKPARLDITILQGATFLLPLRFESTPGVTMDLSGWSARAQIRKNPEDPDAIIDMSYGNGRIIVGDQGTPPSNYNVLLYLTAATTAALWDFGKAIWQLEMTDPSTNVYRWVQGTATIDLEVVR